MLTSKQYSIFLPEHIDIFYYSFPFVAKEFPGIVIAEEPEWKDCIQGSYAVVNLAGLPISTRWSPEVGITSLFKIALFVVFFPYIKTIALLDLCPALRFQFSGIVDILVNCNPTSIIVML